MKTFSAAALAALAKGELMSAGAFKLDIPDDPFLAWTGEGVLELEGEEYIGMGSNALVSASGGQIGATADAIELLISGIDPTTVDLATVSFVRDARTTVWRLMFDTSGQVLLDAQVYDRGRVDRLQWAETPGGTSTIKITMETAAKGLGRRTGRLTADADQRMIDGLDASLSRVTQAAVLTLAWGGKPPARAGQALPGAAAARTALDRVFAG